MPRPREQLMPSEQASLQQAEPPLQPATATSIVELTDDVLAAILLRLSSLKDIASLIIATRRFYEIAHEHDLRVWAPLTQRRFGAATQLSAWLAAAQRSPTGHPNNGSAPATYRQLYKLLHKYSALLGLWKGSSRSSTSALYHISFGSDNLQVLQLVCGSQSMRLGRSILLRLGPSHSHITAEVVDGDKCVFREHRAGRAPTSAAAAAAAAAGAHSVPLSSSSLLGSSPQQTFGFEMLQFMAQSLKGGSGSSRRNRRQSSFGSSCSPGNGSSGGLWGVAAEHCLLRCVMPVSSRQHPLAGMWKGVYGPHGLEVVSVSYTFSGAAASIVATKVTGDDNIPAGQVTFRAQAAPLAQPWSEEDLEFAHHAAAVANEAAREARAVQQQQPERSPQRAQPQAQHAPQPASHATAAQGVDAGSAAPAASPAGLGLTAHVPGGGPPDPGSVLQLQPQSELRVVAIHKGEGQVAGHGFSFPHWVPGRLWVFSDGANNNRCAAIAFRWSGNLVDFMLQYARLDDEYSAPGKCMTFM